MRQQGIEAARDVAQALGDIRTRIAEITALNAAGAFEKLFGGITSLGAGLLGNIPLIGQWLGGLGSMGPASLIVAANIAALAVSLAVTLGVALAGSIVLLAAWTAGLLGITLAVGMALTPLGLIAAGIIALSDAVWGSTVKNAQSAVQTAQWQLQLAQLTGASASTIKTLSDNLKDAQVNLLRAQLDAANTDPLGKLEASLRAMADTWGTKARPMADQMTDWAIKLIPPITQAGLALLDWFGQRLPTIMAFANAALKPIGDALLQIGQASDWFIQTLGSRAPSLGPILQTMGQMGVEAVRGLLTNLMRFVDWFIAEWPRIQPIAQQVLTQVGTLIQWLGQQAANLVNWFIANWPQISKTMEDMKPILQALPPLFGLVGWAIEQMLKPVQTAITIVGGLAAAWERLADAINRTPTSRPTPTPGPGPGSGGGGGGGGGGFQSGGMVPGTGPQLILAHGGEMILNPDQLGAIIGLLASIDRKLSAGFSTRAYASRA